MNLGVQNSMYKKISNFFNRKVKIYKILRKQPWKDNWPDVVKGISMILKVKS